MESFSVIVTAHNMERVIGRTLGSVEAAVAAFQGQGAEAAGAAAEIVVVEDGSSDGTWPAIQEQAAGKPFYRLIRRATVSSPSCARNVGVAAACGELLFFLDGDDLFYPAHIRVCQLTLADPAIHFVKTKVHLADAVHPDWRERINHSVIINLCLRRACHEAVGGFPDWHLVERSGEGFRHVIDIFYKFEDMYYNELITRSFPGVGLAEETVDPGNGFDRQYAKFQHPFGAHRQLNAESDNFRLALCDTILQHRLHELHQSDPAAGRTSSEQPTERSTVQDRGLLGAGGSPG